MPILHQQSPEVNPECGRRVHGVPIPHPRIGYAFHALPKELLRAGDLSFGAVCLLSVLLNETGQGSRPYTKSNAILAFEIGRNRSDVKRYLTELEEAGLIRRTLEGPGKVRAGIEVTWTTTRVTESSVRGGSTLSQVPPPDLAQLSATILKNGGKEEEEDSAVRPPALETGGQPSSEERPALRLYVEPKAPELPRPTLRPAAPRRPGRAPARGSALVAKVGPIGQNCNLPLPPDPNASPPCLSEEEIHAALYGAKERARLADGGAR